MQNNTETQEDIVEEVEQNFEEDDSTNQASSDENERSSKHQEGDPLTFVRVRFPGNAKSHPFLVGSRAFQYGQKVLAMSDRGMTVGYINSFPYDMTFKKDMLPLKSISKVATDEDIEEQKGFLDQEKRAEISCKRLIDTFKLDMNITHVEFIQFGKKAVFYFNAPSRVDFRDLVKSLVGELKMRIELRQISVRDRTAALGAIGSCGLQTCCSSFLKNYGNVSIKMAKNQNLALIPSKLNGVCGQIKCCIKYEDNVYAEKRKRLPREAAFIQTANGDRGKVTRLHILLEQFEMLTDRGVFKKYALNQFDTKISLPKDWKFPERFDHITNETSEIIGLVKDDLVRGELYYDNVDDFDADEYLESLSEDDTEEIEEPEENDMENQDENETVDKVENKKLVDSNNKAEADIDVIEDDEPNFNKEEFNKSAEIDARDNKKLGNKKMGPHKNNRNRNKSGSEVRDDKKPGGSSNRNRNRNRNRKKGKKPSDGGGENKDS